MCLPPDAVACPPGTVPARPLSASSVSASPVWPVQCRSLCNRLQWASAGTSQVYRAFPVAQRVYRLDESHCGAPEQPHHRAELGRAGHGDARPGPHGSRRIAVPADRRVGVPVGLRGNSPGRAQRERGALLMGPWQHESELSHTHRRTPTDYDADNVLLRTIRCVTGEVQVTFDCEPVFDYGRYPGVWAYTDGSYSQAVCRAADAEVGVWLTLTTDMRLGFEGGRAMARTRMQEGEQHFCALSWTGHKSPRTYEEARRRLLWTAHHWQHWLARGRFPDHPWSRYLQRSALTLKGLTFAPTGAMVAAATTSLPEEPGGERNWDYRYCWLRDSG